MHFRILKMIATMLSHSFRVHQIRFRPGELTALPRTPSWFKGTLLLKGRGAEGREGEEKEWRAGDSRGGEERRGYGREGEGSAPGC